MSQFARMIDSYCDRYEVTQTDRRKLLAHYPLFKLAWLAASGPARARSASRALLRPFRGYRISHSVAAPGGRLAVPVSFHEDDLASFKEVFLGDEYASPADLSDARTYVDLGANTGMAALFFATRAPLERLVLVEANPTLVPGLRRDVARSLGAGRVAIENVAVGAPGDGSVTFYVSPNHRHSSARPEPGARAVTVQAKGLGALLDAHGLDEVDILKADIEGGEHEILAREPEALARARHLFVEVHGDEARRDEFGGKLSALGFAVAERRAHPDCGCETLLARRGR